MITIISGSRDIHDYAAVEEAMRRAALAGIEPTTVLSGAAPGVDRLGERWAKEHGLEVVQFPADWKAHGRAAGPIRNNLMAGRADALVAVWDGKSRGTQNMIVQARGHGLKIFVHRVILRSCPTPCPPAPDNVSRDNLSPKEER